MTPVDSVLLSIENTNLHVPSFQFGGNFGFNIIRKNPNISNGTVSTMSVKCVDVMFRNLLHLTTLHNHSCFMS